MCCNPVPDATTSLPIINFEPKTQFTSQAPPIQIMSKRPIYEIEKIKRNSLTYQGCFKTYTVENRLKKFHDQNKIPYTVGCRRKFEDARLKLSENTKALFLVCPLGQPVIEAQLHMKSVIEKINNQDPQGIQYKLIISTREANGKQGRFCMSSVDSQQFGVEKLEFIIWQQDTKPNETPIARIILLGELPYDKVSSKSKTKLLEHIIKICGNDIRASLKLPQNCEFRFSLDKEADHIHGGKNNSRDMNKPYETGGTHSIPSFYNKGRIMDPSKNDSDPKIVEFAIRKEKLTTSTADDIVAQVEYIYDPVQNSKNDKMPEYVEKLQRNPNLNSATFPSQPDDNVHIQLESSYITTSEEAAGLFEYLARPFRADITKFDFQDPTNVMNHTNHNIYTDSTGCIIYEYQKVGAAFSNLYHQSREPLQRCKESYKLSFSRQNPNQDLQQCFDTMQTELIDNCVKVNKLGKNLCNLLSLSSNLPESQCALNETKTAMYDIQMQTINTMFQFHLHNPTLSWFPNVSITDIKSLVENKLNDLSNYDIKDKETLRQVEIDRERQIEDYGLHRNKIDSRVHQTVKADMQTIWNHINSLSLEERLRVSKQFESLVPIFS